MLRYGFIVTVMVVVALSGSQLQPGSIPVVDYNVSVPPTPAEDVEQGAATDSVDETPATPKFPATTRARRTARMVHRLVNQERERAGLAPLDWNARLAAVAEYHSEDMDEREYFSHTGPDGERLSDRYRRFGVNCSGGENIYSRTAAAGETPETVSEAAVESWMDSPGHRENVLHRRYSEEGIGVAFDGGTAYVTQDFC